MNKVIIKDILSYYFSIIEEATSVLKDASIANINRMYRFPNNNDIKYKYYSELKEYFKSIKIDLNVVNFLMSNYKYLDINDIYYTLDKLDITAEEKFFILIR